jgi:UDP-N-acetyl-D-glucosamine/UDP-N-acetyl-D-galactosamine dehydrogenase
MDNGMTKIGIIGLGYVGLPLAAAFGKTYSTIGFDINSERIEQLKRFIDNTLEVSREELQKSVGLEFSDSPADIAGCSVFIITVPTPITRYKTPNLQPLSLASETVGNILKKNDIVVYESTVYPGCTEEFCVPILEKNSGLKANSDFFYGYSPERINPGDKKHRLEDIVKVTSGSTPETAGKIDALYSSIIKAGTYIAESVKIAEAAKVIENCQRDLNIAFVNELSLICDRLNIDTRAVLSAAGTKWNFLNFFPGLVGGHCIGVDPYYLTYKAESLGYHPEVILSGRRINDNMAIFVASKVIKLLIRRGHTVRGSRVLVLGITFKENCPDIRNTKAVDVIRELETYGCDIDVVDPWADNAEVESVLHMKLKKEIGTDYDAVVLAVAHKQFQDIDFSKFKSNGTVIFDIKGAIDKKYIDGRL